MSVKDNFYQVGPCKGGSQQTNAILDREAKVELLNLFSIRLRTQVMIATLVL